MLGLGVGMTRLALHGRRGAMARDIVILAYGQSNEQGANLGNGAPIDPALDQDATGRIRVWRASDATDIAAVQPFADSLWISGSQYAPLRSFRLAQSLLDTTTGKIVIIPCAVGGAKLAGGSLGVDGSTYTATVARFTACLAAFPGAGVILSWTQGEQDANDAVTEAVYTTAFTAMVNGLRDVPGAGDMLAIIHQMVPERFFGPTADLPYRQVIDRAHKSIPLGLPRSIFVPASIGTQIAGDPSHFTSTGHRNAGARAFESYSRAVAWQTTIPNSPAAPTFLSERSLRLTVSDPPVPAYVIAYRATGSTGPWSEQLVFPETHLDPGATFDVSVAGTGDTDVRLHARSYAGTSAASDTVQIVASAAWWHPQAAIQLDYTNDRAFVAGVSYDSLAAARAAGAVVQSGGIDRVPLAPASSWALVGTGMTAASPPSNNSPRYLAALDNGAVGGGIDHLVLFSDVVSNNGPHSYNIAMFTNSISQLPDVPAPATSKAAPPGEPVRMAIRAKTDATIVAMDGVTLSTDTDCTLPAVTQLVIANRHDGTRDWGGTVDQVLFIDQEIDESVLNATLA